LQILNRTTTNMDKKRRGIREKLILLV